MLRPALEPGRDRGRRPANAAARSPSSPRTCPWSTR
jgi:hypothetical protein